MTTHKPIPLLLLLLLLGLALAVPGAHAAGEKIDWKVIGGSGSESGSASYGLTATLGQTGTVTGSSASHQLPQGFWQVTGCCVQRGDVDASATINVSDLTYLVNYLFKGGPAPACAVHGDVDGSNTINVADLSYLVNYLFKGGPLPVAC